MDYFSTPGYQPGIAIPAAGALALIATVVLVLVILFGAVPVYRKVTGRSPHGLGSIVLRERLVSGWAGKLVVLLLLGLAMTDFMVTITLSSPTSPCLRWSSGRVWGGWWPAPGCC